MSAPVKNELSAIPQRLGKFKLFCLLFCYILFISVAASSAPVSTAFGILGLICAAFLVVVRALQYWHRSHENVDILQYEKYLHLTMAIPFLIMGIVFACQYSYYIQQRCVSMFFGFAAFLLFAIEAHFSYRSYQQSVEIETITIKPTSALQAA